MQAMVLRRVGGSLVPETRPDPEPGPGEVRIRVEAAPSAVRISTSSTANCPRRSIPSFPGTRSSARSRPSDPACGSRGSGRGSACPGSAMPAVAARTAPAAARTSATRPASRLHARRRLRQPPPGGGRLHRHPRTRMRPGRDRAATLRRPDRMAHPEAGGREQDGRALRLRRRRPHRRPALPLAGPPGLRLPVRATAGRRTSPARSAPNGPVDRTRRGPNSSTRR